MFGNDLPYFDFYTYQQNAADEIRIPEYNLTTGAAALPVTVAEVLEHLKIDSDNAQSDAYYNALISTATKAAESFTRRDLINKTYTVYFDDFPRENFLTLRKSKVQSITSFQTYSSTGTWENLSTDLYYLADTEMFGRVYLKGSQTWPSLSSSTRREQRIKVVFVAGYGASGSTIPADLKLSLLNHIAAMNEQRGDWNAAGSLPVLSKLIYGQYRITNI